jgi:hypothetical protein
MLLALWATVVAFCVIPDPFKLAAILVFVFVTWFVRTA